MRYSIIVFISGATVIINSSLVLVMKMIIPLTKHTHYTVNDMDEKCSTEKKFPAIL